MRRGVNDDPAALTGKESGMISLAGMKKLYDVWKRFSAKHSDIVDFGKSLYPDAIQDGSVFAIYVKTPDGRTFDHSLQFDMDDVQMAKEVDETIRKK